jgi:hypothetical protein
MIRPLSRQRHERERFRTWRCEHQVGDGPVDPLFIVLLIGAVLISTVIFVVSLFLLEDLNASSFKEFGAGPTLARSLGIVSVATLISLVPYGWVPAMIVWFLGIMFLFQKTFVQTLILTILNNIITFGIVGALSRLPS